MHMITLHIFIDMVMKVTTFTQKSQVRPIRSEIIIISLSSLSFAGRQRVGESRYFFACDQLLKKSDHRPMF